MRRYLGPILLVMSSGLFAQNANEDLLEASFKGDLDGVKASIAKGGALETKTAYGQTPLYRAAMSGHEAVVRYLLDRGADPAIHDTFYKASMLDFVLQRKHYGVAKMLISSGKLDADEALTGAVAAANADLVAAAIAAKKPSQAALDKTYSAALDQKQTEVAALLKKAGASEPAPAVTVDAKTLESYAGAYKSEQIPIGIRAFVKDGALYMQGEGQPEFPLKARSVTVFEFAAAQIVIEFNPPSSFTLKQGGGSYEFKKADK